MDDKAYEHYTDLIGSLTLQNKQLRRANNNMKCEVKQLRRIIKRMKEEMSKNAKPHYKNGKRGTIKNG